MRVRKTTYQQPISQIHPQSMATEAYRTVRTNLQFTHLNRDANVILFTSTQPDEGKTSTVANLAIVYARTGKRVLLIDADLRKPQLHRLFPLSNLEGLSTTLVREGGINQGVVGTEVENLYLLPSGPIPPNPAELLDSENFRLLVTSLRPEFDIIFIDGPPVLAVSDALILSRQADGTVFVINAQKTNRFLARKAISAVKQVDARILGVVLNQTSRPMSPYTNADYYSLQTHPAPVHS